MAGTHGAQWAAQVCGAGVVGAGGGAGSSVSSSPPQAESENTSDSAQKAKRPRLARTSKWEVVSMGLCAWMGRRPAQAVAPSYRTSVGRMLRATKSSGPRRPDDSHRVLARRMSKN
ncbi:hypothetical protein D3C72_1458940 [compost metagenome]